MAATTALPSGPLVDRLISDGLRALPSALGSTSPTRVTNWLSLSPTKPFSVSYRHMRMLLHSPCGHGLQLLQWPGTGADLINRRFLNVVPVRSFSHTPHNALRFAKSGAALPLRYAQTDQGSG